MSQRSLLSFLTKTPQQKNGKSTDNEESPKEEIKSTTTKKGLEENSNSNGTPKSQKKANENVKEVFTSTPKRKKTEAPARGKKQKLSPSKTRKRVEIEDDDDDDVEEVEKSNGNGNGNTSASFNATLEKNFSFQSYKSENSGIEKMDTTGNNCADETMSEAAILENEFEHTTLDFLKPENIRDAKNRRPGDEDYDPKTLYVPQSHIDQQTPVLRVWWKFKSENFDTILLFKVGKFYEIYNMDAVEAVSQLSLTFMKGGVADKKKCIAHCGFPEIAFGRFSDQLVQKGYKVGRIEQTETPAMLEKRNETASGKGKKEKCVRRELCRIITPGTKMYSYLDGDDCHGATKVLFSVCEIPDASTRRYGVCFVDCAVGKVWISEFDDDYQCSRLRTLLAEYPPAEILYSKKRSSQATEIILSGVGCKLEALAWKSEFLTSSETLQRLAANDYFNSEEKEEKKTTRLDDWPTVLRETLREGDVLGTTCKKECDLCVSALGAVVWYLCKCQVDVDVFSLKLFERYEPPAFGGNLDEVAMKESAIPDVTTKTMILDAATLKNLDVLQSSSKPNSTDGTLLELLDKCSTAFGKRLLRHWLCNPLCHVEKIKERQEAIGDLLKHSDFVEKAILLLKQMPDLERLLQKIHTMGTKKRLDHPDSRAVFFDADKYNKRKVDEFLATLDGLRKAMELANLFRGVSSDVKAKLLRRCLLIDGADADGRFPDLRIYLKEIESQFDRERAKKDGIVVLTEDLAKVNQAIDDIVAEFDSYLKDQRKQLSNSTIKYAQTTGKNRYLLQIPEAIATRLSADYAYKGEVKGYKRFSTEKLDELLEALQKAEDARDVAFNGSMRKVFEMFSDRSEKWRRALDCMAIVDVLLSLVAYAQNCEHSLCVPNMVSLSGNQKPFIEIVNGYHPCSAKIYTTLEQFVPNDTIIGQGDSSASILLLTGPNMGGKSTLMRQVASLVILAQIGSYVPAESFSFSIVDRVFTRLGACDRLSAGQSTFAVELTETNMILRHATVHSLVIIDELGRGTATHDGAAIAFAVLKHLAENRTGPRTLFSTHYHSLVTRLQNHDNISLGHMACTVEKENETDDDPTEETITFLYKLAPGACPKSYGFHAAKLAGISNEIVKRAHLKAREMESMLEKARGLRNLASKCQSMTDEELISAVEKLSTTQ